MLVCGANEYYDKVAVCDATCTSPAVCYIDAKPGCACLPGYVREKGVCILQKECNTCHGQNEEYLSCGYCEFVCGTGGPRCPPGCRPQGCYCKQGFVRDEENNCILRADCPGSMC